MKTNKHQIVIIGGGAGGLSVASQLRKHRPELDIAIVEPSEHHYYQPAWTLVGGGAYVIEKTRRAQVRYIPRHAKWIRQQAVAFEPEQNTVVLADGSRLQYEHLVVAAGIQLNWDEITGLQETLGKNGVTSNYSYACAPYTWECLRNHKEGRALFTQPPMPIKCPGAPQKILYLAADYFRKQGLNMDVRFYTAGASMFGVAPYAKALAKVASEYGLKTEFGHNLVAVDGPGKIATFEVGAERQRLEVEFDMIHVVPPQSAPDFIKQSPLANADGWVAVNRSNMRHERYGNIHAIGDCTSAPHSKTAAAVRQIAPVVSANLLADITGEEALASYDGYASCPVTTSRDKVMLCEFAYDGAITPSFSGDPRKPRHSYWLLKRYYLPWLYWRMIAGHLGPDQHAQRELSDKLPLISP